MKDVEGWISCELGNFIIPKNNKAKQVKSTEYANAGSYPVVDQSADFICGYHDDATKVIGTDLPLTVFGDHTRHTKFIPFPFIAGADGTQILKPRPEIEDKFFYYLISYAANKMGNFGYDRHFKHLKEFVCHFPSSKREQAKIADILSNVDRAIEQTEALIAKQQRIKNGLMQDLLTRGIDEHGNLRSEETHQFKDSPLGRIPVEWKVVETKKVCSLITKGTTPKLRSAESLRYSIPYLRVQNLTFSGQIDFSEEIAFIDRATHDGELARSKVLPGDVLQNIVGPPLGKIGIVSSDYPEWNINQAIALFRPSEEVLGEFLCHWLQVPATQTWFDVNSKKTSGQQNLTLEHCQELPIVLPSLEEQTRICQLVANLVVSQRTGVSVLQKFRSLKTALMQDLLTGKKRVTPMLSDSGCLNEC